MRILCNVAQIRYRVLPDYECSKHPIKSIASIKCVTRIEHSLVQYNTIFCTSSSSYESCTLGLISTCGAS